MNRIKLYLTDEEVDGLMAEADRNLRGMGEQARWWIQQAIAATVDDKTSVHMRTIDKAEAQAVAI